MPTLGGACAAEKVDVTPSVALNSDSRYDGDTMNGTRQMPCSATGRKATILFALLCWGCGDRTTTEEATASSIDSGADSDDSSVSSSTTPDTSSEAIEGTASEGQTDTMSISDATAIDTSTQDFSADAFTAAVERATGFLAQHQEPSGEFAVAYCLGDDMTDCFAESSPFGTTFVLYSLRRLLDPEVVTMRHRALDFIAGLQESSGLWRYMPAVPPDLDDTATASHALRMHGIDFIDNLTAIEANKNTDGLYWTWVEPDFDNDVDCAVNANVLLYLQEHNSAVCSYLLHTLESRQVCSLYYPNPLAFYYMLARALSQGVACLDAAGPTILARLNEMLQNDELEEDFTVALAAATLLSLGHCSDPTTTLLETLLTRQATDGSFAAGAFFVNFAQQRYGSKELTTAFAIDALSSFSVQCPHASTTSIRTARIPSAAEGAIAVGSPLRR